MDLPLELGAVTLEQTADTSGTRLRLIVGHRVYGTGAELSVPELQELAGTLLQWLDDHGHAMPAVPAGWVLVEASLQDTDEDEPDTSRPPADEAGFGMLVVVRDQNRVLIQRADPWVRASGELLDELAHRDTQWSTVNGLEVTLRDDAGSSCRYLVRPDVSAPSGTVVLQRMASLLPDVSAVPEHTR